ncbi:hypothetical protein [Streptomyces sp. NPDC058254]|uniref:hypothetical protein n=1 Tax=Streptomyces sp. NPDC058254 TaxID=3346406 RepID=UPI0036E679E7
MATAPRKTAASSRKPRTAARSASRPPVARQDADLEEFDESEITDAEAQEIEAEGHYVTTDLCGEKVQAVPASAWRSSWQRMLNQGNLDGFAEKVLHPEDYELYLELDPTVSEFLEFTEKAASASGESLGKSGGPGPSSRRTRRR